MKYLEQMLISFWRFLPGIIFGWVFALAAPNGIALYGLLILLALPTYCTAASKTLGHYPKGEGTGKQLGLMLSLLLLLIVLFMPVLLLMLLLSVWIAAEAQVFVAIGVSLLLFGLFAFRFWPTYAAAFITGMPVDQQDWTWGGKETIQVMRASWQLTANKNNQRNYGYLALPALALVFFMPLPLTFYYSFDGNPWGWWLAYLAMTLFLFPLANLIIIDQAQQLVNDADSPDLILEDEIHKAIDKVGETAQEKKDLKTYMDHIPDYLLKGDEALVAHLQTQEQEKFARENKRSVKKQMMNAIEQDNMEWLEQAIARGIPVDGCDKEGEVYFTHAAEFQRIAIMRRLLELGANIDIPNKYGKTGLALAIDYGMVETTEFLLQQGASLDALPRSRPALHLACSTQHIKMVRFLVAQGLDIEQASSDDLRPLDFAIKDRRLDTVEYLIGLGADVHHAFQYNTTTHTPLTLAVLGRSVEIIQRLIQAGADPSTAPPEEDPPLIQAANLFSIPVLKVLLESGADANALCRQGYDAVWHAGYQDRVSDKDMAEAIQLIRRYQR